MSNCEGVTRREINPESGENSLKNGSRCDRIIERGGAGANEIFPPRVGRKRLVFNTDFSVDP